MLVIKLLVRLLKCTVISFNQLLRFPFFVLLVLFFALLRLNILLGLDILVAVKLFLLDCLRLPFCGV